MTPEDFTAELSGRLRHQGVAVSPADLEVLVKSQGEGGPSMAALTDCFVKAGRTYAVEFHKRREARNAMLCGAAYLAAGLAACLAYLLVGGFDNSLPPPVRHGVEPLLFGLMVSGPIGLACGGLLYGLSCYRSWRASNTFSRLRKASDEAAVKRHD
jgi:hypothetical protein